jgi:hypothetical protein
MKPTPLEENSKAASITLKRVAEFAEVELNKLHREVSISHLKSFPLSTEPLMLI